MENLGNFKTKIIDGKQLDLPLEDLSKKEKEKEIIPEGEFQDDYQNEFNEIDETPIFNLTKEDLKKMSEDPEQASEYYAVLEKINEINELEHKKRMNEMAEDLKQEEINELKKSIDRAIDERDDKTGGYNHFGAIAQQKKMEAIKIKEDLIRFNKEGGKTWKLDQ